MTNCTFVITDSVGSNLIDFNTEILPMSKSHDFENEHSKHIDQDPFEISMQTKKVTVESHKELLLCIFHYSQAWKSEPKGSQT